MPLNLYAYIYIRSPQVLCLPATLTPQKGGKESVKFWGFGVAHTILGLEAEGMCDSSPNGA
jgi:hypothetical protein